eukprot:628365-Prymnesium_polylepis.3
MSVKRKRERLVLVLRVGEKEKHDFVSAVATVASSSQRVRRRRTSLRPSRAREATGWAREAMDHHRAASQRGLQWPAVGSTGNGTQQLVEPWWGGGGGSA